MRQKTFLLSLVFLSLFSFGYGEEPLWKAVKGKFLMGVAINTHQAREENPTETKLINTHFNSIVPENCMKAAEIHPEENRFNFQESDQFVHFGEKYKKVMIGHCLIWHSQLPRWFCLDENGENVSAEVLKDRMRRHIYTIVNRYKGIIHGYDVVNEAFEDNGSYRNSRFYQILGKDFIRLAFQYAHEADPKAELYYNDYNMYVPAKCEAVVEMVKELKAAGCRIDAVGMQGHMNLETPTVDDFEKSINKLASTGVKVNITEWDVSILPVPHRHVGANISDRLNYAKEFDPYREGVPDSVQQIWDKKVLDMFALFLKHSDVIDRVTVWGLNDRQSWKNNFPVPGRCDYPLLFDRNNQPKKVVYEMIRMANAMK